MCVCILNQTNIDDIDNIDNVDNINDINNANNIGNIYNINNGTRAHIFADRHFHGALAVLAADPQLFS